MTLGRFSFFFWFTLILIVHEFGHAFAGMLLGWKIQAIHIYPFGGMTEFREPLNRPIWEEFLILVAGPLTQQLFFILMKSLGYEAPIFLIHYGLLLFNLLPILPLDGSKGVELLLELFFPYRLVRTLQLILSSIFLFLFFILSLITLEVIPILLSLFLLFQIHQYDQKSNMIMTKFLLERHLYQYHFKRKKIIWGYHPEKMYRQRGHLFYIDHNYHTEREILRKTFDF